MKLTPDTAPGRAKAGKKGGLETLKRKGKDFFAQIGKKGGKGRSKRLDEPQPF